MGKLIDLGRYRALKDAENDAKEALALARDLADKDLIRAARTDISRIGRRKLEAMGIA